MITSSTVQVIKANIDIVDIISNYIELRKGGVNFKAPCPFHGEKTASFTVSPTKQIFHCFGCKQGGDAIKFVQDYEKLNYPEALEKIASMLNITVEYEEGHGEGHDYKNYLEQVNNFYVKNLTKEHLDYLHSRGLTDMSIKEWGIGYAPRNPATQKFLEQNFLPLAVAKELGIMAESSGRIYSRFSERVMFPICNHTANIVGFAGRTLKTSPNTAKYLNSPDTKLFDKSKILFGFDKAKATIYKTKRMIVHEGQLDVALTHQHGFKETVATQGTALTEKHLPLLRKGEPFIILAYDGDKAGRAAALKAAILLSVNEFDGAVVLFPDGLDPAELMATGRAEEYKALIDKATPIVEFVITTLASHFDISNPHEKNKALKECLAYLRDLNVVVANEYIAFVAKTLNLPLKLVSLGEPKKREVVVVETASTIEDNLLFTMYLNPSLINECVNICDAQSWVNQEIYWSILQHKITQIMMSGFLINENIRQLEPDSFIALAKQKQKSFLLKKRENNTDFDEVLEINKRLKEVS